MPKVDWNLTAETNATFKSFEVKGNILYVYLHEQDDPIKCSSSHSGDYKKAIISVTRLKDGDKVLYVSRGVNIYSSKEWFFKIDKNLNKQVKDETLENLPSSNLPEFSDEEKTVRRIFGPPGTGKTHSMMKIIEERLSEGVKPQNIAFVSYNNVAANEAKKRIADHFSEYKEDDFIFFRTIHSLATALGGFKSMRLMESKDILKFDKTIFSKEVWTEPGKVDSIKIRDIHPCLALKSLVAARKSSIEKEIHNFDSDVIEGALWKSFEENNWVSSWTEYLRLKSSLGNNGLVDEWIKKYNAYKLENNFFDYDDVISNVISSKIKRESLRFELLIIDEAQDCSEFMWEFLKEVIKESKEVIVCGDDDQAIMEGFGASRMAFLDLETNIKDEELPTSHRLSKKVYQNLMDGPLKDLREYRKYSKSIRKEKAFGIKKDAPNGGVHKFDEFTPLFISIRENQDKEWLIMTPTNESILKISITLKKNNISHYLKNEPIIIGNNATINNIRLQTIHTSKGAEAEYVGVILLSPSDEAMYFLRYFEGKPRPLGRYNPTVRYVAESRAKNQLFICRRNKKGIYHSEDYYYQYLMDEGIIKETPKI